ncbi:MAG: CcoQ/FixQ family Cbb3-type cytochrome c oxidase assembly chaperone [Cytophagales bacterium]|jgi:cytochrome c oxidase cbb3-type subunit IV
MIKNVLNSINGVDIYPIISLFIFVPFFVGLLWWVYRADNDHINKLKNIPLDSPENNV